MVCRQSGASISSDAAFYGAPCTFLPKPRRRGNEKGLVFIELIITSLQNFYAFTGD